MLKINLLLTLVILLASTLLCVSHSTGSHNGLKGRSVSDDDGYDSAEVDNLEGDRDPSLDLDPEDSDISFGRDEKSSSSFADDTEDSPDLTLNDMPVRKTILSDATIKRNAICDQTDTSPYCFCQRRCSPALVGALDPCRCTYGLTETPSQPSTTEAYDIQQPLVSSPQESSPTSPSLLTTPSLNCLGNEGETNVNCACIRACVPGIPLRTDPCTCMDFSSPSFSGYSAYNAVIPPAAGVEPFTFNTAPAIPMPDYSNSYYLPNTFGPYATADSRSALYQAEGDSCSRACLPFTMQQQSPCQCDFTRRADEVMSQPGAMLSSSYYPFNAASTSVSSYPIAATPAAPHNLLQPNIIEAFPKMKRPPTSIGLYLGCYHDKKKPGRDLKISMAVPKLTPDACVNKCREKKKRFAAVQNGYLCFCGSRFGRYKRAKDEMCGSPCAGDPTKVCGGPWLNSVYSTDGLLYSPHQFSFKTRDPPDELEAQKNENSQKKLKKVVKGTSSTIHSSKGHAGTTHNTSKQVTHATTNSTNNVPTITGKPKKQDHVKNKPKIASVSPQNQSSSAERRSNLLQQNTQLHETKNGKLLESASSPSDMAALLVRGKKGNQIKDVLSQQNSIDEKALKKNVLQTIQQPSSSKLNIAKASSFNNGGSKLIVHKANWTPENHVQSAKIRKTGGPLLIKDSRTESEER